MREWNVRADELSAAAIGAGEPTAWFDRLYAAGVAGEVSMPWDRTGPQVRLEEWARATGLDGAGRRAVVVGCGLGADAAYLAGLGFATTGFDISPTAVDQAHERHADAGVDFVVGDLLDLPDAWLGAFDLVVEIFTVQALPDPPRRDAIAAVPGLVAPGGTLLAVEFRADGSQPDDQGPPFPQDRDAMLALAGDVLEVVSLEELEGPLWRLECRRSSA